ncbi:YcfL family protein [Helicobacter burdigaliensis]|uniref:YcfL family protein n=1 Tax=Helicobacter burdigaliensis TaxID=2315334 RepID=UPI000EF740E7|nr:YcfL family protein [Helicobacter burdigaliensis]
MRNILLVFLGLTIIFVGCSATYKVESTSIDSSSYVSSANSSSIIKSIKKRNNINGLLEVEILLLSEFDRDLTYKITWLDDKGFSLPNSSDDSYRPLRLSGGEEFILKKMAIDKRAKEFKIDIKTKSKF